MGPWGDGVLRSLEMVATSSERVPVELPADVRLNAAYPNPFSASTTISFDLPTPARVVLRVFDSQGREIETLVDAVLPDGAHGRRWSVPAAPSGLYIFRLESGEYAEVRALIRVI